MEPRDLSQVGKQPWEIAGKGSRSSKGVPNKKWNSITQDGKQNPSSLIVPATLVESGSSMSEDQSIDKSQLISDTFVFSAMPPSSQQDSPLKRSIKGKEVCQETAKLKEPPSKKSVKRNTHRPKVVKDSWPKKPHERPVRPQQPQRVTKKYVRISTPNPKEATTTPPDCVVYSQRITRSATKMASCRRALDFDLPEQPSRDSMINGGSCKSTNQHAVLQPKTPTTKGIQRGNANAKDLVRENNNRRGVKRGFDKTDTENNTALIKPANKHGGIQRASSSSKTGHETVLYDKINKRRKTGHEVVLYDHGNKQIVQATKKKRQLVPKVDLDEETLKFWARFMRKGGKQGNDVDDQDDQYWAEQRRDFKERVNSFISIMHEIQGDRTFSKWKGSVLDSVIGVFLTQNVSDHLSSNAFLSLIENFPAKSVTRSKLLPELSEICPSKELFLIEDNGNRTSLSEEAASNVHVPVLLEASSSEEIIHSTEDNGNKTRLTEEAANNIHFPELFETCSSQEVIKGEEVCEYIDELESSVQVYKIRRRGVRLYGRRIPLGEPQDDEATSSTKSKSSEEEQLPTKKRSKKTIEDVNWEDLRQEVLKHHKCERNDETMDSLDYEAVRCADVTEVCEAIKDRGLQNMLAKRIQDFLNRLMQDHGSLDLEWLRYAPPETAKDFLLSVDGLGLKSAECVRLLTLLQTAFPVDINVGRIVVRLGWVPLQPLPESLLLHLLEKYPVINSVQKYLWPRLCTLDQQTLYEFHYHLITFGKVFCTKKNPNCNACPLRYECDHFAGSFVSSRLALPAPEDKSSTMPSPAQPGLELWLNKSEAIIEEPSSPEPETVYIPEADIEDSFIELPSSTKPEDVCTQADLETAFWEEDMEGIPAIKFNIKEIIGNMEELEDYDLSKAVVALPEGAASISAKKLKTISRLRTEHQVYELTDDHVLLSGFEPREKDDPSPYLLVIWNPCETASSIEQVDVVCASQTVQGTLLIPCRTATMGTFPLNATYFQVNEVFADHETSLVPINVRRELIWDLRRRTTYFGTSVPSIFREQTFERIKECFKTGFICVRAFDRKARGPRPLMLKLHLAPSKRRKG